MAKEITTKMTKKQLADIRETMTILNSKWISFEIHDYVVKSFFGLKTERITVQAVAHYVPETGHIKVFIK